MPKSLFLGEFEQLVLLAVMRSGTQPYALQISREIENAGGRAISRGALYRTLDRLEGKGFVRFSVEPGGPERGGHARRRFAVTSAGERVLSETLGVQDRLREGLAGVKP
ncbi:MAG TPA: PadR family transcriptional regulator [Thermoanaerobaculia bacterium]|nr:PadR family transcriptional regulator [Thermoanaerobaculia bacterium]